MTDERTATAIERELDYYKRQVDTLAGENLKLDYVISGLRLELKQKRQGFALLSLLHESIGKYDTASALFAAALPAINATVGMDRTILLTPAGDAKIENFVLSDCAGYKEDEAEQLRGSLVTLTGLTPAAARILANKSAESTLLLERLRAAIRIPYYVCVPVLVEEKLIALLVSGRLLESAYYPSLDQGDLDTFQAISGLLSAGVRNMRVGVLEQLDRLKTEFFANISHEFRTPITLTLGPLEQLLNDRYGPVSDDAREQLRVIHRNQERLLSLVNQILDLAKLEAGGVQLQAALTPDVNRVIAELASQFESVAHHRGLELVLVLSQALDGADLYVDHEKLERLLWNLLSNALKFTRQGRVTIETKVVNGAFMLTVSDTGIGIRDDQLPYIFDRFRQADGSESREFAGTGIGLSLVKQIASLHGGSVTVRSRYGEGTSFRVSIPLGRAHLDTGAILEATPVRTDPNIGYRVSAELAALREGAADITGAEDVERANRAAEMTFNPSRATILYAEDHPDLRRHVSRLLGVAYNVFLAFDGRDAFTKAQKYRPDLVLSDHMMPNMTGRDLLRALRDDPELHVTPVIILTARAGSEARIESLDAGADDYLTKPFNEGELLARVRNVLRAKSQERKLAELNRRLEARVQDQLAELVRNGELQQFLPRALVEQVLSGALTIEEGRNDLARERVTILAVDIAGLAELTQELEPEDLASVTNELLREFSAIGMAKGGTVDRLSTEGVQVLFGAPRPMEPSEQATAAANTALAMRERLAALGVEWQRRGVSGKLEMRAGIQTGFCTIGVFGSDVLRSYTAVGTPVAVALHLLEDASMGSIVCGAATRSLLKAATTLRLTARGARVLRGFSRPIESYEIFDLTSPQTSTMLPRLRDFAFMPR